MTIEDDFRIEMEYLRAKQEAERTIMEQGGNLKQEADARTRKLDQEILERVYSSLTSLIVDGTIRMSEKPYYCWAVEENLVKKGFPGIFGIGKTPDKTELVFKKGERLGDFCPAVLERRGDLQLVLYYGGEPPTDGDKVSQSRVDFASEMEAFWYDKPHELIMCFNHQTIHFRVFDRPTGQPMDLWIEASEKTFGKKLVDLLELVRKYDESMKRR